MAERGRREKRERRAQFDANPLRRNRAHDEHARGGVDRRVAGQRVDELALVPRDLPSIGGALQNHRVDRRDRNGGGERCTDEALQQQNSDPRAVADLEPACQTRIPGGRQQQLDHAGDRVFLDVERLELNKPR